MQSLRSLIAPLVLTAATLGITSQAKAQVCESHTSVTISNASNNGTVVSQTALVFSNQETTGNGTYRPDGADCNGGKESGSYHATYLTKFYNPGCSQSTVSIEGRLSTAGYCDMANQGWYSNGSYTMMLNFTNKTGQHYTGSWADEGRTGEPPNHVFQKFTLATKSFILEPGDEAPVTGVIEGIAVGDN